ncbi:MAG TPA: flagellar hook-length control protein FliK [Spirochaetia bacterium]|nr:flagellar hook-length control protein FliK [Spirochaetia bacterium]
MLPIQVELQPAPRFEPPSGPSDASGRDFLKMLSQTIAQAPDSNRTNASPLTASSPGGAYLSPAPASPVAADTAHVVSSARSSAYESPTRQQPQAPTTPVDSHSDRQPQAAAIDSSQRRGTNPSSPPNDAPAAKSATTPQPTENRSSRVESGTTQGAQGDVVGTAKSVKAEASVQSAALQRLRQSARELVATLHIDASTKQALLKEIQTADLKTLKRLIREWSGTGAQAELAARKGAPPLKNGPAEAVGQKKPSLKQDQSSEKSAMELAVRQIVVHLPSDQNAAIPAAVAQGAADNQQFAGNGSLPLHANAPHATLHSGNVTTIIDLRQSSGGHTPGSGNQNQQPSQQQSDSGSARLLQIAGGQQATAQIGRTAVSAAPATSSFQQNFQTIADQLVRQTGILLKDNNMGEIRLLLKPDNLGSVRIRIDLADNNLTGRILVDNNQVAKIIQQNLEALYQGFRDSGFASASLNVSVGGKHGGEREKGKFSPLPTVERISGSRSLDSSVPMVDAGANAYSLVNLIV